MRIASHLHALAIARSIAGKHIVKFLPVDFAELVMPGFLVEFEIIVGHFDPEEIRLRHRHIDELLAQFII